MQRAGGLPPVPLLTRRSALATSLAGLVGMPAAASAAAPDPKTGVLIVAGPPGGRLDQWAAVLSPVLGRNLPARAPLDLRNIGGIDGVTGANQFDARGEPDGSVALLVPGVASIAWLTGEMRARFDPTAWVPLWAGIDTAVVVSRYNLVPGISLKVAANGPVGVELPALLALELQGIHAVPTALSDADTLLMTGARLSERLAEAASRGFLPVMTFGYPHTIAITGRDPRLDKLPTCFELLPDSAPHELVKALHAATLAVQLDVGLVLPALTPASAVSMWRMACSTLYQSSDVRTEAEQVGTQLIPQDMVAACARVIASDRPTLLALRRWLGSRYDWRPS